MAFFNPVPGATYARTDQGVDYAGSGNVLAPAAGTITKTSGWIFETFTTPVCEGGRCYTGAYFGERAAVPGLQMGPIAAGQPVMQGSASGYEIGFLDPGSKLPPLNALGDLTWVTQEGIDYNAFVCSLGGPCASQSQISAEIAKRGFAGGGVPLFPGTTPGSVQPGQGGGGGGGTGGGGGGFTKGCLPKDAAGKCPPDRFQSPFDPPGMCCGQGSPNLPGPGSVIDGLLGLVLNTRVLQVVAGSLLALLGVYLVVRQMGSAVSVNLPGPAKAAAAFAR